MVEKKISQPGKPPIFTISSKKKGFRVKNLHLSAGFEVGACYMTNSRETNLQICKRVKNFLVSLLEKLQILCDTPDMVSPPTSVRSNELETKPFQKYSSSNTT